jgi:hypothetical protein
VRTGANDSVSVRIFYGNHEIQPEAANRQDVNSFIFSALGHKEAQVRLFCAACSVMHYLMSVKTLMQPRLFSINNYFNKLTTKTNKLIKNKNNTKLISICEIM